jgi:uncharacterized protein YbjT (DUF2867 family)
MTKSPLTILAVGASGTIGRHVVDIALGQGHKVRALVRSADKIAERDGLDIVIGDLANPNALAQAVEGVDAIVFTHGSSSAPEAVDYGAVRNVLAALNGKAVRIALMTAIGVTDRKGAHDWKRRAERLVRASGNPFTIVRPGWFDYNDADQHRLVMLQGDKRQYGTPRDGVIARRDLAQVLVSSLTSDAALRKTFELVADRGPQQDNFDPLFKALDGDVGLDGIHDAANMPLSREPQQVQDDLGAIQRYRS